ARPWWCTPRRRSPTCPNRCAASAPRCCLPGAWRSSRAATTCTWSSRRRWRRCWAASLPPARDSVRRVRQLHRVQHATVVVAVEGQRGYLLLVAEGVDPAAVVAGHHLLLPAGGFHPRLGRVGQFADFARRAQGDHGEVAAGDGAVHLVVVRQEHVVGEAVG